MNWIDEIAKLCDKLHAADAPNKILERAVALELLSQAAEKHWPEILAALRGAQNAAPQPPVSTPAEAAPGPENLRALAVSLARGETSLQQKRLLVLADAWQRDREDAERYRWLRRGILIDGEPFIARFAIGITTRWTGADADAAIDKARGKA